MELENIIITSKQPEYKENETLNFLLIFVCYVHDFVPSMVRLSNGIGMHFKQDRGEKIVVHFCQDYISYTFNGYKHTLTHYPTIRYIYHLMSLMTHVSWIRVVVKKCFDIVVSLLHNQPTPLHCTKSILHVGVTSNSLPLFPPDMSSFISQ